MPSPVGHALAGLAIGWIGQCAAGSTAAPPATGGRGPARVFSSYAVLGAAAALAPDLDLLVGSHRTAAHSLGAAVLVGLVVLAAGRFRGRQAGLAAAVCGAAWGSHALLDWLGRDTSPPVGLMILWPVSHTFYASGLDLFSEVSRRYWNPDELVVGNLRSVVREVLIIGPLAAAAFWCRRRSRAVAGPRLAGAGEGR